MSSGKVVIVLYTSVPNTTAIEQNQRAVVSIIKSKGVEFIEIDGANQENKDLRSILWSTPNSKRAIYPQVFIKRQNDIYEFIGDYEEITELNRQLSDCLFGLVSGALITDSENQESGCSHAKLHLLDDPENPINVELSDSGVTIVNRGDGMLKNEELLQTKIYDCLHNLLLQVSPMYMEKFFSNVSAKLTQARKIDDNFIEEFD